MPPAPTEWPFHALDCPFDDFAGLLKLWFSAQKLYFVEAKMWLMYGLQPERL
jgi:hypothetical protein